jgi:hypothetical protein
MLKLSSCKNTYARQDVAYNFGQSQNQLETITGGKHDRNN